MRVFIYRRTHVGDPCQCGIFGVDDCMGQDRSWHYDAVLGVGVDRPDPGSEGIAGRLTWVGIGPHKHQSPDHRGPNVTFDHFCLLNAEGPLLGDCAPLLAAHMVRVRMSDSLPFEVRCEVDALVRRFRSCRRSRLAECRCQGVPRPSTPDVTLARRSSRDKPGPILRHPLSKRCR